MLFKMSQCSDTTISPSPFSLSLNQRQAADVWGRLVAKKPFIAGIDLRNEIYIMGRNESCEIYLSGTKIEPRLLKQLSKKHCEIKKDATHVPMIRDLSKNGTYLNGLLIGRGKCCTLCDGDLIAIGWKTNDLFQFRLESSVTDSTDVENKYKFTRLLGKGAFGEVYLVYERRNCMRYAVKKIKIDQKCLKSISTEINILKSLGHPCVIEMKEVLYGHEHVFIVLEYMAGGVLEERVLQQRRLSEDIAKLYMYQMVLAVQYLHNQGITHRDLKPENVLLADQLMITKVKVTDFGLSKMVNENCMMRTLCGTPMYVAPEVHNKLPYLPVVDVWSLGCILYFMLFGSAPFALAGNETTLAPVYARISKAQFTMPIEDDGVSNTVTSLIRKMLTADPDQRIDIDNILMHDWLDLSDVMLKSIKRLLSQSSGD